MEVEERIQVRPQAEPRARKAIWLRKLPFRYAKTAPIYRIYLRDGANILTIFSHLQTKGAEKMGTLPPRSTETVTQITSIKPRLKGSKLVGEPDQGEGRSRDFRRE